MFIILTTASAGIETVCKEKQCERLLRDTLQRESFFFFICVVLIEVITDNLISKIAGVFLKLCLY